MKRFDGKVAVVTGGNSGIGLATAKAFAREGASVVITGRDEASLKKAGREIGGGTLVLRADVSQMAELDAAMGKIGEHFKQIDALFVNAGVGKFVPFDQVTEAFFDETVAINLKGVFFTVHKALPLLLPGAAVVLNASINAHKGMPGTTVYGATKAAVVNLAKNDVRGSRRSRHPSERNQPGAGGKRAARPRRDVGGGAKGDPGLDTEPGLDQALRETRRGRRGRPLLVLQR